MAEELVSICIPTMNQSEYIIDTLDSVLSQSHTNIEIIISDDAGTDDTQAIVFGHMKKNYPDRMNILKYHRNKEQLGIGGNFDQAVRMANAEYIVKVDSDDFLAKDFVSKLLDGLKAYPNAGWAHCNVLNIMPDKKPIGIAHAKKSTGYYRAEDLIEKYLTQHDTCHCVMLRRSAYLISGGYRKEMLTDEDHLLWIEMALEGYGCYFSNEILAQMRKYPMRKIMTNRRKALLISIPFMESTIKKKWTHDVETRLNMNSGHALMIFNKGLSKKVLSASINESDFSVRVALRRKAIEVNPSISNKIYVYMLSIIPQNIIYTAFRCKYSLRERLKFLLMSLRLPAKKSRTI